jgi:hypothetical protein
MKFVKSFLSSLMALHFSVVDAASPFPLVDLGYIVQQATLNVSILLFALGHRIFRGSSSWSRLDTAGGNLITSDHAILLINSLALLHTSH